MLDQHNLGRSAAASDLLLNHCQVQKVDIALLQEPYTNRGKLTGFEVHPLRTFLSKPTPRPGQPQYTDVGAAIVIFNPNIRVFYPRQELENFVTIVLDNGSQNSVTLISGYFKYRTPTIQHIVALESALSSTSHPCIMALDANAFSTRWFSRVTDHRGEVIEDFITANNLICHNANSSLTTFHGASGSTNIDITLSSFALDTRINTWRIIPDATSSDHRVLAYNLSMNSIPALKKQVRFNVKRANWDLFNFTLAQKLAQLPEISQENIDGFAKQLNESLCTAADTAIPRSRSRSRVLPPWWSPALILARQELKSSSRALRIGHTTQLRVEYNQRRNHFSNLLRKEKTSTWRTFCTEGGKDTWGRLYKWLKKTKTSPDAPPCLNKQDGTRTSSLDESVAVLLNSLIPNEVAPPLMMVPTQYEHRASPYTKEELHREISQMSPNKAPGLDLLTAKMVKISLRLIENPLIHLFNSALSQSHFPSCWKHADVICILKGPHKDIHNLKSYRPISLLLVHSKLLENAINRRLTLEKSNQLSGKQFGFTPGKSTEDAISNLLDWNVVRPE